MNISTRNRFILHVTCGYLVFGSIWVFLSDSLLMAFADISTIAGLSTAKGITFIILTALLLLLALFAIPDRQTAESQGGYRTAEFLVQADQMPRWIAYAFAVALTLAMLIVRMRIAVSFEQRPLLILFMPPIILSSVLGGLGPGLAATAIAALGIDYTGVPPMHSLRIGQSHDLFQWFMLIASGILSSYLSELLHKARRQSEGRRLQQEAAQDALRQSEKKYRLITENTADIISILDMNLHLTYCSPAVMPLRGFTAEEAMDQTLEQILTPESLQVALDVFEKEGLLEAGGKADPDRTRTLELEEYKKDGSTIWMELNLSFQHDKDNKLSEIIIVARDISERKRADEAMKESEVKYRSMMEAMDDAAYICSGDFRIEYMNAAMIQRIGSDATGEICHKVMHGLDKKCPWCMHEKVMKGQSIKAEVISPRDGRSYHVSNSPIFHSHGVISKLTLFRDITEIKKIGERLLQAQKMESIGNLAGGIAHDFNNLLYPIIGLSEMLLEDLPPGSLEHENVQQILIAGKRGSDLVKQILAFSRQSEHRKMPVRVQQILKEVLKLSRSAIPMDIEISQDIQSDCGLVLADPTQLHQIAMNLVTNAYHAVEQTGGKISVLLKETTLRQEALAGLHLEPGLYAKLSIADTGCGINAAVMDKIFQPYFTTKEQGKGTGLGLAVVYGIVIAHGGDIKVYSEEGKGATFTVYLPLMGKSAETVSVEKMAIDPTGTEKILLIDDEAPVLLLEEKILERLGYKVTSRTSSIEAFNAFQAKPDDFDLIISDMSMPGMTGDQLARKIISIRPDIPVIICTGFSERINAEKARSIGVKGFLMKPIVKSDMAKMVRKALDEATGSIRQCMQVSMTPENQEDAGEVTI